MLVIAAATVTAVSVPASATMCGTMNYPFPFTDVAGVSDTFCLGILEAFVVGITRGTTPTTFGPNVNVSRLQMTTFLQRTLDQGLKRNSRRAALEQWWVPRSSDTVPAVTLGGVSRYCAADGEHIWAAPLTSVVQIQASTGRILGIWTGLSAARRLVVAMGKVFVTERTQPGRLLFLDPTQTPTVMTLAAGNLGNDTIGLAFDGARLWTANASGSVSIVVPQPTLPYLVTTVSHFASPTGVLYDGSSVWVVDNGANALHKVDPLGSVVQTVPVGDNPGTPIFDGTNIWVPNTNDNSVTVVLASNGAVVSTIAADASNALGGPTAAAFDGERILITNQTNGTVTLFKAADLSVITVIPIWPASASPFGACSDGINFWVTDAAAGTLLRL